MAAPDPAFSLSDSRELRIILASGSPRRRDLLAMIGIVHDVIPADVDETYFPGEEPSAHAERLALAKSAAVAATEPRALIIAADTIVVIGGQVLGKPRDAPDAARMLRMLSGRTHQVHTAIAVVRGGAVRSAVEVVDVTFRELSNDDIAEYIRTGEPMDKAGAYGIQGYGATIVKRIEGDYFAVMGLSLHRLTALMRQVGATYAFQGVREE